MILRKQLRFVEGCGNFWMSQHLKTTTDSSLERRHGRADSSGVADLKSFKTVVELLVKGYHADCAPFLPDSHNSQFDLESRSSLREVQTSYHCKFESCAFCGGARTLRYSAQPSLLRRPSCQEPASTTSYRKSWLTLDCSKTAERSWDATVIDNSCLQLRLSTGKGPNSLQRS